MLTTKNFKLKKIELTDSPPDITVLNFNWDTLDTNLKEALDRAGDWDTFQKGGGNILGKILLSDGDGKGLHIGANRLFSIGDEFFLRMTANPAGGFSISPTDFRPAGLNTTLGTQGTPWKGVWAGTFGKSRNGYDTLTNGVIIQWGKASFSANTGGGRVTFPLTFPTECYTVLLTNVYANSKAVVTSLGGTETTNSSFYTYLQDVISNASPTYTCTVSWLAIGS